MSSHRQGDHIHQQWDIWAEPDPDRPGFYLEKNRCAVCRNVYFVYVKPDPIPEGMATEPPAE